MKKFLKWILNCDYRYVLCMENIGFAVIVSSLIIGMFVQFIPSWVPLAVCNTTTVIGLVVWLLGMLWQEIRERTEELWQSN